MNKPTTPSLHHPPTPPAASDAADLDNVPAFLRRRGDKPETGLGEQLLHGAIQRAESAVGIPAPVQDELAHLRALVARRYLPGWVTRLLRWITGTQDTRPLVDAMTQLQQSGAQRLQAIGDRLVAFDQTLAAHRDHFRDLIDHQGKLADAIQTRIERDNLKAANAKQADQIRALHDTISNWETQFRDMKAAQEEQRRLLTEEYEHRLDEMTTALGLATGRLAEATGRLAKIRKTSLLLDLQAAFQAARTETEPKSLTRAIAKLTSLHETLQTLTEPPAATPANPAPDPDDDPSEDTDAPKS